MTLLTDLKHKNILVLGAGITGMSCVRYLSAQDLCFAVNDSRLNPFSSPYNKQTFTIDFPTASLYLGQWQSELIANADIILLSPGINTAIDEIAQYISDDCLVMGDVELFCQLNLERGVNDDNKPIDILALTGSNGKSTVVSLLDYLAKSLGINAQLGGNIGQPVLDILTEEKAVPELLILELSSFQLETLTSMQAIATSVLNVSDDHLDRHLTMENYTHIKQNIYQQGKLAITNRDDFATHTPNKSQPILSFGSDKPTENHFGIIIDKNEAHLAFGEQRLIALAKLPLAGMHNALNYLTALAFGYSAGWSLDKMINNLAGFAGLAHRCQRVTSQDNIAWINDSKATNVGATIAAINGLAQTLSPHSKSTQIKSPALILIAGGDGKGADFMPLAAPLAQYVSHLITLGKDGDGIAKLVANQANVTKVKTLIEAVQVANSCASAGDVVLLSPACASLDMFKSFSDRGDQFSAAVHQLTEVS
jgi:UDP-N-acetylmuramoylalanine--D-glutamate ligase